LLPFAVAVTLAIPLAFVVEVDAERVALAPFAGAVKLTATPGTGFPLLFVTRALSGVENVASTVATCVEPPDTDGTPVVQAEAMFATADCAAICLEMSDATATRLTVPTPGMTKL
jgi:hypothetical protein